MNEKIYIQRKYNKCLNILLAIYVVLCLVLSLFFNGFFVKSKAFTNNSSWTLEGTCINNIGYGTVTQTMRLTSSGYTRAIYYVDDDFAELLSNKISANNSTDLTATCIMIRSSDNDLEGSISSEIVSSTGNGSVPPFRGSYATLDIGSDLYNYFSNKGVTLGKINNRVLWVEYQINGTPDNAPDNIYTANFSSDVEFVDNPQDLYKYLIEKDESVVKVSNPDEPEVTQDGNLPTPQKVNLWDSAQNCAGLTWDNPKSINNYIKDLGDNVGVEIEWKPSIALTLDMLTIDSLTSSEWLPVYKGVISKSGSLINAFVSKKNDNARLDNNLNGYNYEIDDKYIFTPTVNDNDYLEQIAKNNHVRLWYANEDNVRGGSINETDVKNFKKNTFNDSNDLKSTKNVVGGEAESSVGEEGVNVAPSGISKLDLIQGIITGVGKVGKWIFNSFQIDTSNYRVRYYVKDGNNYSVSNWVDAKRGYDTNENAKEPTNVNFTDSNNNPVSNPTYLPSNQVTSSDSNSNNWWDRFYTENNNVLANLQTAFANFTADSGDFFGFFRALFTEFPEFYIFLCMGLGLAIMLRILGR